MILEIPIDSLNADSRRVVSLDSSTFVVDLSWSPRASSWYVSILAQNQELAPIPVVQGIRVAIGYPVLAGVTADLRPLGELIAVDLSGGYGTDPDRDDLGERVRLYYYDAAEMDRA